MRDLVSDTGPGSTALNELGQREGPVSPALVSTESLTKRYASFLALDSCTLRVARGEVFGLLGPNGAGKTTLIRILLGFLKPTSGSAVIDGFDCVEQSVDVRHRVAYLPAEVRLFRRMRAKETLQFFAELRGRDGNLARALELARRLDLDLRSQVSQMSTGMRQKLALAATLSHDVPLYILDEPTANLDPNVRSEVLRIVAECRREGRTVMLSSHVLSEIEEACQNVVILRGGRLVHQQDMSQLRQWHRITGRRVGRCMVPDSLRSRIIVTQDQDRVTLQTEGDLADVLSWLDQQQLSDVRIEPYGLRAVYERFHASEVVA